MNRDFWKEKRVLIAGGAGFIGSHLVDALLPFAKSVTVVDGLVEGTGANVHNLHEAEHDQRCLFIRSSVEAADWNDLFARTDVVYNLASVNSHKESMEDPLRDVERNLLPHLFFSQALPKSRPLHVILASSRSVYGKVQKNPVDESAAKQPLDFYSVHTLTTEHYYRLATGTNHTAAVLRFPNIYGPRQRIGSGDIGAYGQLLRAALTKKPMKVFIPSTGRDTLFVKDAVSALVKAGEMPEPFEIYNVGGVAVSMPEFCVAIQSALKEATVEEIELPDELKAIQVGAIVLDAKRFSGKTGWKPVCGLQDGVKNTIDYFIRHKEHYL